MNGGVLAPPNLHRIERPHALKIPARRAEYSLTENVASPFQAEPRQNLELPVDLGRLPKDQEMCLFRLVQECLTNIHRHSGSSTALVRLWRTPGEIRMEVSDEGRGIHQEIQSKVASGKSAGVGLRGKRERDKRSE